MRILLFIFLFFPLITHAKPDIKVVGLFKNKALVVIDGKQKLMHVGETYSDVTLDSADSRDAVLSFDGVSQSFTLGSHGGFSSGKTKKASFSVTPSYGGTYKTTGSINGKTTEFIIDTGASTVSINSKFADILGIDYKNGKEVNVLTASSKVTGYMVSLDTVTLGSIRLNNIDATVLEGEQPEIALLGMSFLKYLTVVNEDGRMKLIQK